MQELLVIIFFLLAVAYLSYVFYKNSSSKSDCAKGCGGCSSIDVKKIEDQMKSKGLV